MQEKSLINGIITAASIEQAGIQDYIEVELEEGQVLIITASVSGRLKIGLKINGNMILKE